MSAVFVTATGTDIGKTFVCTGLIRHLRAAGRPVDAVKPVVSGFRPEAWQDSDPAALLAALGGPHDPAEGFRPASRHLVQGAVDLGLFVHRRVFRPLVLPLFTAARRISRPSHGRDEKSVRNPPER